MSVGDIHNRNGRIEKTVKSIKESEYISDYNKEQLLSFRDFLYSQDLSKDRIARYLYSWYQLLEHIEWELDDPTKDRMIELVGKVNQNKVRDRELSPYTKMEYKKAIRKFYVDYLESKRNGDFDGEKLCDFFSLTVNTDHTDPDRLPTPSTVRELFKHSNRIRDKAFITTLWSSAGRIGEVLGLQWKDVKFDSGIAKVRFRDTKTGGSRTVPLRAGYLYLQQLQEQDPRSSEPEAFLFRGVRTDKQLSHSGASNIIKRARENTDIPSRIKTNPHAFRKGRATYLAKKGMNQAQLCSFGGWAQGSSHVAKYIRMAESDVENSIKKISGMQDHEKEIEEDIDPVKCHKCGELNKFEAETCRSCGEALKTSDLYGKVQVEKRASDFKDELIKSNTDFEPKELDQKAKEFVKEELEL